MKNFYFKVASLTALLVACAWFSPTYAAVLSFSAPETVAVGEVFTLHVLVESSDRGFNAAEATILFPNDLIEIVSVDTAPSSTIFNFWLSLPEFLNDKGVVSFSGGTTRGVVGSAVQILAVRMRAKGSGEALITASDASINASDGSGTNILQSITARGIRAEAALVTIPQKIEPAPKEEPKLAPKPQAAPVAPTVKPPQIDCEQLFADCDLPLPSIQSLKVGAYTRSGAQIAVSGTVEEGSHVRLHFIRSDGVEYKEIVAIVKPDKTWEGILTSIYAYGTYSLEAVAEAESSSSSEPAVWTDIRVFPPYTLYLFGFALRWYLALDMLLSAFIISSGVFLTVHFLLFRGRVPLPRAYGIVFGILVLLLIGMLTVTYYLWNKDYAVPQPYWKDTKVRCVNVAESASTQYAAVDLKVYVDGDLRAIPTDIGLSPLCVAQIHTHDNTGRLHFDPSGAGVTLNDFFVVAGESLKRDGYALSATLNGKEFTDQTATYALQNNDVVVVKYTRTPAAE